MLCAKLDVILVKKQVKGNSFQKKLSQLFGTTMHAAEVSAWFAAHIRPLNCKVMQCNFFTLLVKFWHE